MKRVPVKPGDLAWVLFTPSPTWNARIPKEFPPIVLVGKPVICDKKPAFEVLYPDTGERIMTRDGRYYAAARQDQLMKISPDDGQFDLEVKYEAGRSTVRHAHG